MQPTIQLLHFADIHIGMENYGRFDPKSGTSSRVADFLTRMDEVIDHALNQQADLVIFAGDAFKTRDPDPTQQREFARRIRRLAEHVPTLLLTGNHDIPGMAARATSLEIYNTLGVSNVIVADRQGSQVIETRSGPVFVGWVAYPMRNRLLVSEKHREKSIAALDDELRTVVMTILDDLAAEAENHDMPRVLTGHFSVSEATLGSERSVMLGSDVTIPLSTLADERWDYVALGHIHKHQDVNRGIQPPVVYSGSLERIDFGEEREAKGFCWVNLARKATTWSFVEVDARLFETIKVDVTDVADPMEKLAQRLARFDFTDKVVRLIVTLNAGQVALLRERELTNVLGKAYSFSVVKDVQHETRARLGTEGVETLTPAELTEKFLMDKQVPPDRISALLEKAKEIFESGGS